MDINSYEVGALNRFIVIAIVVLCLGLVIVLVSQNKDKPSRNQLDSQSSLKQSLEFDAFAELLAKSDRQELFELLESIQFGISDSLPTRLEKSRQRIDIANRILDASTDSVAIDEANALLIEKILQHLQILFAEDIDLDGDQVARLSMFVKAANSSSNLTTQKSAAIAKVFLLSIEYSRLSPDGAKEKSMRALNNAVEKAAQLDDHDLGLAQRLIYLINEVGRKGIDNSQLMTSFRNAFGQSTNASILDLVQDASRELNRRRFKLESVSASLLDELRKTTSFQSNFIKDSIAKISSENQNEEYYLELVSAFIVLAQTNPTEARSFLGQLDQVFLSEFAPLSVRDTYFKLGKALRGLDTTFSVARVTCKDRNQQLSLSDDRVPSFLFVVGPDSIDQSERELAAFQTAFAEILRQNEMQFFVIFIDGPDRQSEWDRLKPLVSILPNVKAVWLTKESSRQFREQVPVPWLPSWFLIDRSGILKRVNTSGVLLRSEIVEFVSG